MAETNLPKWQEDVEEIIRKKFPANNSPDLKEQIDELFKMAGSFDPPSGELGKVVALAMAQASKELRPLAAIYAGFTLGMAWVKLNAR